MLSQAKAMVIKMKVIDLTHVIKEDMPVYPGTQPPKLQTANTIEKDGFRETLLTMFSHTGTHMDAPAHVYADEKTLDALSVDRFVGKALIVDCRNAENGCIGIEHVEKYGDAARDAEFLIFRTGWAEKWNTPDYFKGFPCIDSCVADFLIATGKKGVGVDTIGIDPVGAPLDTHLKLLKCSRLVIIENLTNLEGITGVFTFAALPLKFLNADGAPIRAIAMV